MIGYYWFAIRSVSGSNSRVQSIQKKKKERNWMGDGTRLEIFRSRVNGLSLSLSRSLSLYRSLASANKLVATQLAATMDHCLVVERTPHQVKSSRCCSSVATRHSLFQAHERPVAKQLVLVGMPSGRDQMSKLVCNFYFTITTDQIARGKKIEFIIRRDAMR